MPLQVVQTAQVRVLVTVTDPDHPDQPAFTDALYFEQGQVPGNAAVRQAALVRYQDWRQRARPARLPRAERLRLAREARDNAAAQAAAAEAQLADEEASADP